jgi:hypothetical protein
VLRSHVIDTKRGRFKMTIPIFRVTEARETWYVWSCTFPELYCFGSDADAASFANRLAEAHGGTPVHMEQSIEQAASLI